MNQASPPPTFLSQQVTSSRRFYRNLDRRPTKNLTVVCGGWEECSADYVVDRAGFPFLSIEFVASGRGELCLDGRAHALDAGSVFTYGPGIQHRIASSPDARLGKYFVDFHGGGALRLLRAASLAPGTCVELRVSTEVRHAFDTLVRLGSTHDRHTARACALQLELLVLVMQRAMQPGTPSGRRALASFERCRQHLDRNFLALRTLGEAAASCHVDTSYLCRLFQRFHGERPFRYLQRLQMQWAAERLHHSGRLVREVADEMGIDPFQFSRTFKRIHGVSPSAFLDARG